MKKIIDLKKLWIEPNSPRSISPKQVEAESYNMILKADVQKYNKMDLYHKRFPSTINEGAE